MYMYNFIKCVITRDDSEGISSSELFALVSNMKASGGRFIGDRFMKDCCSKHVDFD